MRTDSILSTSAKFGTSAQPSLFCLALGFQPSKSVAKDAVTFPTPAQSGRTAGRLTVAGWHAGFDLSPGAGHTIGLPGNRPVQEGGTRMLTIGEFARASRLSAKALRLYDELGLLRPARVDPDSGYRYYEPSQLERARLVAWLRRLGMPLAQIGAVVAAPPAEAAAAVTAFLRVTEAEFSECQRLAQFLIGYFSEGATAMPVSTVPPPPASGAPLAIRYAAAS